MLKKTANILLIITLGAYCVLPTAVYPQMNTQAILSGVVLPPPGTMIPLSKQSEPLQVNGLRIYPEDPFRFDFIVNPGPTVSDENQIRAASSKLIKYFLASLTVPEKQLWVNLSPYEKERIIPKNFGKTKMGRDLLAQDYLLKQLTASLMYPENPIGHQFWTRVYKKVYEQYGVTDIPLDTFKKVWIVPDKAVVFVNGGNVFITKSHLKVMMEEDYLERSQASDVRSQYLKDGLKEKPLEPKTWNLSTEIIREIILPEIEKEVNFGENFGTLRQIYHATILAAWLKKKILSGEYTENTIRGYIDHSKTKGIDVKDKNISQKIYNQYINTFKKGVYNYLKEDYDPETKSIIPRKYFSGGYSTVGFTKNVLREDGEFDPAMNSENKNLKIITFKLIPWKKETDKAMITEDDGKILPLGTLPFMDPEELLKKNNLQKLSDREKKQINEFYEDILPFDGAPMLTNDADMQRIIQIAQKCLIQKERIFRLMGIRILGDLREKSLIHLSKFLLKEPKLDLDTALTLAVALGKINDPNAVPILVDMLTNFDKKMDSRPDRDVLKIKAEEALQNHPRKDVVINELMKIYQRRTDTTFDFDTRIKIIALFQKIKDLKVVPLLASTVFFSKLESTRKAAHQALHSLLGNSDIKTIGYYLNSALSLYKNPDIRGRAIRACYDYFLIPEHITGDILNQALPLYKSSKEGGIIAPREETKLPHTIRDYAPYYSFSEKKIKFKKTTKQLNLKKQEVEHAAPVVKASFLSKNEINRLNDVYDNLNIYWEGENPNPAEFSEEILLAEKALSSPRPEIFVRALFVVSELRQTDFLINFMSFLFKRRKNFFDFEKEEIAKALGRLEDLRAAPYLIDFLTENNDHIANAGASGLLLLAKKSAKTSLLIEKKLIEKLRNTKNQKFQRVNARDQILSILFEIASKASLNPCVAEFLSTANYGIRNDSLEIIQKILPDKRDQLESIFNRLIHSLIFEKTVENAAFQFESYFGIPERVTLANLQELKIPSLKRVRTLPYPILDFKMVYYPIENRVHLLALEEKQNDLLVKNGNVIPLYKKGNPDSAMISDPNSDSKRTKGGIDLSQDNLDLETQGKDNINIPIPRNFKDIDWNNIDGVSPVIINMLPVNNLPLLLGQTGAQGQRPNEQKNLSSNHKTPRNQA